MFKIISIIVLVFIGYRLVVGKPKEIPQENTRQEPDEFVDYEEVDEN